MVAQRRSLSAAVRTMAADKMIALRVANQSRETHKMLPSSSCYNTQARIRSRSDATASLLMMGRL